MAVTGAGLSTNRRFVFIRRKQFGGTSFIDEKTNKESIKLLLKQSQASKKPRNQRMSLSMSQLSEFPRPALTLLEKVTGIKLFHFFGHLSVK